MHESTACGRICTGGVATYISMLLNHPRHTEIKDYIICSDKNSEHKWALPEGQVHYYTYHWSIFQILPAMIAVWKEIRRLKPDVILNKSPREWAEKILKETSKHISQRRQRTEDVKAAGFDSAEEARRLDLYYSKVVMR